MYPVLHFRWPTLLEGVTKVRLCLCGRQFDNSPDQRNSRMTKGNVTTGNLPPAGILSPVQRGLMCS